MMCIEAIFRGERHTIGGFRADFVSETARFPRQALPHCRGTPKATGRLCASQTGCASTGMQDKASAAILHPYRSELFLRSPCPRTPLGEVGLD